MELAKNVKTNGHNTGSNKRGRARAGDAELILRTTQKQSDVMMVVCSRL